jgi:hypothetical protein
LLKSRIHKARIVVLRSIASKNVIAAATIGRADTAHNAERGASTRG